MNKLIYILLFIISLNSWGQWRNWDMSFDQYFLTYAGASNTDTVGQFYLCYTYDTIATPQFSITAGNGSGIYGITATGGMLYIVNNTSLTAGEDILTIKIVDSWNIKYYTAMVHVHATANSVFIDADAVSNGTGTRASPFDGWDRIVTFTKDYAYLQKRGTTESDHNIMEDAQTGDVNESIWIGAYGSGARPIIDGTAQGDATRGIRLTNCSHWRIHALQIQNFDYGGIELEQIDNGQADSCFVSDVKLLNNGTDAVYTCPFWVKGNYGEKAYHTIHNIESTTNQDEHGLKISSGNCILKNAYTHDNGGAESGEGLHLALESTNCTGYYIKSANNTKNGINIDGDTNSVYQAICEGNLRGIAVGQATGTNPHNNDVDGFICRNNTDYDVGIKVAGESYNNTLKRGKSYSHDEYGINISGDADDVYIEYCEFYDNTLNNIYIAEGSSEHNVYLYNLISYDDADVDINEAGSKTVTATNCFYKQSSGTVGTTTCIDLDDITLADYFQDYINRNFMLKSTAANAINQGTDLSLTRDIRNYIIPQGAACDIGANERITDKVLTIGGQNKWININNRKFVIK